MEEKKPYVDVSLDGEGPQLRIATENLTFFTGKKKVPKQERWFMGYQNGFTDLAADKELTGTDKSVMLFLFGNCDFENWVKVSQQYIASQLNIPRPEVNRSIKKLSRKGIIRVEKVGRSNAYQIDDMILWKGKYSELQKQREKKIVPFPKKSKS